AARNIAKHLVHHLANSRTHFVFLKRRAHQPNAAIDVETDTAGRNYALLPVRCGHSANREPVALVDVRHRQTGADDAWEHRHVHRLAQRLVLADLVDQLPAGVDDHVSAHAPRFVARNSVTKWTELFEFHGA